MNPYSLNVSILLLSAFLGVTVLAHKTAATPSTERASDDPKSPRTVLVTGANRGIGLEFATQYAAAGWRVLATARDPAAAKELIALGDRVEVLQLDVTNADSVATLAASLKDRPIDLLINNAGVGVGVAPGTGLADVKVDEFAHVLEVNLLGPVRVTQALLPSLRAGTGKTIVNISSGLGSIAGNTQGGYYGYRESKAGLDMFTRNIAAELKSAGFICIAMTPGWVKTDMGGKNAQLTPEESVTGMRKVLDALKPSDTGKMWSHDGSNPAW